VPHPFLNPEERDLSDLLVLSHPKPWIWGRKFFRNVGTIYQTAFICYENGGSYLGIYPPGYTVSYSILYPEKEASTLTRILGFCLPECTSWYCLYFQFVQNAVTYRTTRRHIQQNTYACGVGACACVSIYVNSVSEQSFWIFRGSQSKQIHSQERSKNRNTCSASLELVPPDVSTFDKQQQMCPPFCWSKKQGHLTFRRKYEYLRAQSSVYDIWIP
jgi:hypothetical protein